MSDDICPCCRQALGAQKMYCPNCGKEMKFDFFKRIASCECGSEFVFHSDPQWWQIKFPTKKGE